MLEIIPAILEKDFSEIEKKIRLVEQLVSWVQIDLADNTLVSNTTFLDPEPFAKLTTLNLKAGDASGGPPTRAQDIGSEHLVGVTSSRTRKLEFELHMMVKDPLRYVERFAKVGFKRFFAHVEGDYVEDYIAECYKLGVEAGLVIDGPTPFGKIREYLDNIDCILVMAIEAGFSGEPFREDTIPKIQKIKEAEFDLPIAVDGAMNYENAKKVVEVGATRINSNSYIFGAKDVEKAIEKLKSLQFLKTIS